MRKYDFVVSVMADSLDTDTFTENVRECVDASLPDGALAIVKDNGSREMSVQGYKVARARVFGVTADQAGDSANPKKVKAPNLETATEAVSE